MLENMHDLLKKTSMLRRATTALLIFLGCLLGSLSVAIVWLHEIVADTGRYVETVAPLSADPAIKDAVATQATNELLRHVDAGQIAREALPQRAGFLADPIAGAFDSFVYQQVRDILDSPEFSTFWKESNRRAHQLVLQVITGKGETVFAEDGKVNLDLGNLLEDIKRKLAERGIFLFQNVSFEGSAGEFTIFESPQITQAQKAVGFMDRLAFWLPLLALAFWSAGILLAGSRRLAILWAGLGLAIGMVALQLGLQTGRNAYLGAIEQGDRVNVAAATSFFDIIVRTLLTSIRGAFALGLLGAAAAFLAGPSSFPVRLRTVAMRLFHAAWQTGPRIDLGPVGEWIKRQKSVLRGIGVLLALAALVLMDRPSVLKVAAALAALAVYLGALEFISRKAA